MLFWSLFFGLSSEFVVRRHCDFFPHPSCETLFDVFGLYSNKPSYKAHVQEVLNGGRCRRGRSEIPYFPSKLQLFTLVLGEIERKTKITKNSEEKNEEKQRKKKQ